MRLVTTNQEKEVLKLLAGVFLTLAIISSISSANTYLEAEVYRKNQNIPLGTLKDVNLQTKAALYLEVLQSKF